MPLDEHATDTHGDIINDAIGVGSPTSHVDLSSAIPFDPFAPKVLSMDSNISPTQQPSVKRTVLRSHAQSGRPHKVCKV